MTSLLLQWSGARTAACRTKRGVRARQENGRKGMGQNETVALGDGGGGGNRDGLARKRYKGKAKEA